MLHPDFFNKSKTYAGIGSRETPVSVLGAMTRIAAFLEKSGYVLNSGGADGADNAFEIGVKSPTAKSIFLPWDGFCGKFSGSNGFVLGEYDDRALEIAKKYYHTPKKLSPESKIYSEKTTKLMTRNSYQVLGFDLVSLVDFVVCYTSDGKNSGGTGQAMRIADDRGIPIFNLKLLSECECIDRIKEFI